MGYSFTIDKNNEGVLEDGIPAKLKIYYDHYLNVDEYLAVKSDTQDENDQESFDLFIDYLHQYANKAEQIHRDEPLLMFPYYFKTDFAFVRSQIKSALGYNRQGLALALSAIPKDFKGKLAREHPVNQHVYLLASQLMDIIQTYITKNTKLNFEVIARLIADPEDEMLWYDKPKNIEDAEFHEIVKASEEDFEVAIKAFIKALAPLMSLIKDESADIDYMLMVLHIMNKDVAKALDILNNQPVNFRSMMQRSVISLMKHEFAEALYYFRKGLLMNRHFVECIYHPNRNFNPFQYYEDLPDCSYEAAYLFLYNVSGALWWKPQHRNFAQWGYNLAMVLEDRAALMREYERLQHLNDFTMPTASIQDRVTMVECERAVQKVRNSSNEMVHPWMTFIDVLANNDDE